MIHYYLQKGHNIGVDFINPDHYTRYFLIASAELAMEEEAEKTNRMLGGGSVNG